MNKYSVANLIHPGSKIVTDVVVLVDCMYSTKVDLSSFWTQCLLYP